MNQNNSIKCSVQQCKYNNKKEYCSLDQIMVSTHESNPKECECTDCKSFELE